MKTLQTLTVGILFAVGATAATAADEPSIPTIAVTPQRPHAPDVERIPPRTPVEIAVTLPTDMPEAEIDYHLTPIGALRSK
jgi:hypothetical protein